MARRVLGTLLVILTVLPCLAATQAHDDSCDIALLPAATLLLPYFEVDVDDPTHATLFTVINVGSVDQIAHVTLWTDRGYPVFGFDIYLTGYDEQSINLHDVLGRGLIAPELGTGTGVTRRERYSGVNRALDLSHCVRVPSQLDAAALARLQRAFRDGVVDGCAQAGGAHELATGYATIDVVDACGTAGVTDDAYWTRHLRYDNVLTGDYTQVDTKANRADSEPLVHIRAIPAGGTAVARRLTPEAYDAGFGRTFYGRFQPASAPRLDARQPLPSQFAARWIHSSGENGFATRLKIWRESRGSDCASALANAELTVNNIVAFDEDEHVLGTRSDSTLPATSSTDVTDTRVFPPLPDGVTGGWMQLDLDGRTSQLVRPRQAWVISSMSAGRFSTDVTASAIRNGCATAAAKNDDDSCDVGLYPAATLLLPYFQVDLRHRDRENTLFSVTNVSGDDRIARVTLWTDYGFPVLAFNLALGPYDVQSINLYDVLADGHIAAGNTGCAQQVRQLPDDVLESIQLAFTEGEVPPLGDAAGCNNVGNLHDDAIGYATIDVVRNCSSNLPTSPEYWTDDIAYDNVLVGDHQQLAPYEFSAQGSPLVHIRAVPEAPFASTFYAAFQSAATPKRDGRQPLPSRFAGRWIAGGWTGPNTFYDIWRAPRRSAYASCAVHDENYAGFAEIVVFDEAENAFASSGYRVSELFPYIVALPATSRSSILDSDIFPQVANGAVAGWAYLNLDRGDGARVADGAWVVLTTIDQGLYSVAQHATALANGCAPPVAKSRISGGAGDLP